MFAFFTDFGLISYGPDGEERWRAPLGPFNNPFGMGASPVLVNGKVIQACDAETGSFLIAVDQRTGKTIWRKERPDATRGFSTPVLHRSEGRMQAILAGTNKLTAYDVDTGEEVWWVRGLTWQVKPTPVVEGDIAYVLGWAGGSDQGNQENLPPFAEVLASYDANKDGKLAKEELPNPNWQRDFAEADLERDGALGARDWQKYQEKRASVNSVMAVRLGGKGDMTEKGIVWQHFQIAAQCDVAAALQRCDLSDEGRRHSDGVGREDRRGVEAGSAAWGARLLLLIAGGRGWKSVRRERELPCFGG